MNWVKWNVIRVELKSDFLNLDQIMAAIWLLCSIDPNKIVEKL